MRFFTSDLHLGHQNIIDYCDRPHNSVLEMHLDIVERWNAMVGVDDEVYIVGDLAMGRVAESLQVIELLNGARKILVPGNHDGCWKGRGKSDKQRVLYESAGLEIVDRPDPIEIASRQVLLCHFPTAGDTDEYVDKFSAWRPSLRGEWLVHGHVHQKWRQRGREINVGVDAWGGYPVAESQLEELITAGAGDLAAQRWRA